MQQHFGMEGFITLIIIDGVKVKSEFDYSIYTNKF